MRLLPWLLLLLAIAGVAALGRMVASSAARTPADYLALAESLLAETPPDRSAALRELDFGIDLAERADDTEALVGLLEARGRLYRSQRALGPAGDDFERLLTLPGADPVEIYVELGRIALADEDWAHAIEIADSVLAEDPTESRGHEIRGEAQHALAEALASELGEAIEHALPAADAPGALELADRIAHLPAEAPLRAALLSEFDTRFADGYEDELDELRPLLLEAGRRYAEARAAFVAALTHGIRRDAAYLLLDGLLRAGDDGAVVDLGMALAPFESIGRDVRSVQLIGRALAQEGRPRAAAQIITQATAPGDINVPRDFLPIWAEILHTNQAWGALLQVALDMTRSFGRGERWQAERDAADFFRGIAQYETESLGPAATSLRTFVNGAPIEPVPGAIAIAWRRLADIERVTGDDASYRQALERVVANAPDESGPSWVELVELRERSNARAEATLEALTQAIRLQPELLPELLPHWHEQGQRTLDERGRDLEQVREALSRRGQWTSPEENNVYEHFRLAEIWTERGRANGAISACQRILGRYPRFLPAYDLLIDTYLGLERDDLAVPLLLERLEFAPRDPRGVELLRELDAADRLSNAERRRLMELDPRYSGLIHLTTRLLEEGDPDLVAQAFAQLGEDRPGSGAVLLAARAELGRGNPRQAADRLTEVPPEDGNYCEAFALRVVAALRLTPAALDETVAAFETPDHVDLEPLLESVETLLLAQRPEAALTLLRALDGHPSTRDDRVVARRALAELMAREFAAARESLERALAFRTDGFVELGELLMTVQEERWSDLRRASLAARASAFEPDPFESCLLSALEGRVTEALAIAAEGEANAVAGAPWGLARAAIELEAGEPASPSPLHGERGPEQTERMLLGTPEEPRDPRTTLAILLALRSPDWAPWAGSQLDSAGPEAGMLWPRYLRALVDRTLGDAPGATARLRLSTEAVPDFAPAWLRLEELEVERLGRVEHPTLLALRAARAAALGVPPGESAEAQLLRAQTLERNGRLPDAARIVQGVLDADPGDQVALLLLGRIQLAVGQVGEAVRTFGRFFVVAEPELAAEYVPEFLTLLELARVGGALSESAFLAELEALETRHRDDPAIAAVRAEREIRLSGSSLEVGLGRAWRSLELFQRRIGDQALDALREGSSARWFELYLAYDPDRAEAFAAAQLERDPADLELWLMLGRAYEAQGRGTEAIAHYERLVQMVPTTEALRRWASLLADLGSDHRRVTQLVDRIEQLEPAAAEDPSLELILARSMVSAGGSLLDPGLERLQELWDRRERISRWVPTVELAFDYGVGLLHRAEIADRGRATEALAIGLELTPDDFVGRDVRALLASLGPRIPAPGG